MGSAGSKQKGWWCGMGVVSKSGLAGAVQAGRLELLPGRQVDDDGDEFFQHGVASGWVVG